MSLFRNLTRIITAPLEVADELIVKPIADVVEDAVDGLAGKDDRR